jgi:hypothetical protein
MKRLLIVVGATAALMLPNPASAAAKRYLGTVHEGGTMSFTVHSRAKKVLDFHWADVPVTCQPPQDTAHSTYTFSHAMNLRHGEFHGLDVAPQGGALHVSGALTHHGRRAEGTLKISGDISEGNGCESGRDHWHAHTIPR